VPRARTVGEPTTQSAAAEESRRPLRLFVAILWTVAIMVLCWIPRDLVKEVEDQSSWFDVPHLDKVVHCAIFAIFSVLWLRARPVRQPLAWIILSGFALAVLTEIVQGLPMIGRDSSVGDMVTDGIGVLLGVALAPLVEPLAILLESRLPRKTTAVPVAAETAPEVGG
jgi:hypothetical protein